MIKSKNADSLVWIIVWVFILSFALLGIMNILSFNKNISENFSEKIYSYLISTNWDNLIKKIDTSIVWYNEDFYIYKDSINKEMKIYTWTINEHYAYIDKLWNNINKDENIWKTYKRVFNNQTDVLRHKIEPNEISNLVLHLDAQNVDWTNNSTVSNLDAIITWVDISWNNNNWIQWNPNNRPIFTSLWITNNPYLKFDSDKMFEINNSWDLNDDWNSETDIIYDKKSIAVVFRTWFEIENFQNIYEQWSELKWYSIQIESGNLYAWIWNNTWDSWEQYKYVDMWEIIPDSIYFVVLTQDSTSINDNENKIKLYLNWNKIDEIDHIDPQTEHPWQIWLWSVFQYGYKLFSNSAITTANYSNFFEWWGIWEFMIWNNILTNNDIRWLNNYFNTKWLNLNEHIIYNVITNKTTKYNPNPN